jgi:SAM-dependent methyltransferase
MTDVNTHAERMSWENAVDWLRRQQDQQDLVLACFFDDPLQEAAERYYAGPEWRAIQKILPSPPGTALDLGAGRGIASFAFAKDGWGVTALEPDPSNLIGAGAIRELAMGNALPITVVEDWSEALPFHNASFDVVHARQVLHHAHDLSRTCEEIARILRPGGLFIATREHVISRREDLPVFLAGHPLHQLYGGENAFLLTEYRNAIQSARMVIIAELSPWESDINLFPTTKSAMRVRLRKKFPLPISDKIVDLFLHWKSKRLDTPGRLYTFISRK